MQDFHFINLLEWTNFSFHNFRQSVGKILYIGVVEAAEIDPPVTVHHVLMTRGQPLPLVTCQTRQPEHASLEHYYVA